MHDWSARDAIRAAEERHKAVLRQHAGYPMSNGARLSILCACGMRGTFGEWYAHLLVRLEATKDR